jgi:hypothetical protein
MAKIIDLENLSAVKYQCFQSYHEIWITDREQSNWHQLKKDRRMAPVYGRDAPARTIVRNHLHIVANGTIDTALIARVQAILERQ